MNNHLLAHGYEFHEPSVPTAEQLGQPTTEQPVYAMTGERTGTQIGQRTAYVRAEDSESIVFNVEQMH